MIQVIKNCEYLVGYFLDCNVMDEVLLVTSDLGPFIYLFIFVSQVKH